MMKTVEKKKRRKRIDQLIENPYLFEKKTKRGILQVKKILILKSPKQSLMQLMKTST
jgi:hypothetical protein